MSWRKLSRTAAFYCIAVSSLTLHKLVYVEVNLRYFYSNLCSQILSQSSHHRTACTTCCWVQLRCTSAEELQPRQHLSPYSLQCILFVVHSLITDRKWRIRLPPRRKSNGKVNERSRQRTVPCLLREAALPVSRGPGDRRTRAPGGSI